MKKAILSVNERRERITIRYKRRLNGLPLICEECGKQLEAKTIEAEKALRESGLNEARQEQTSKEEKD